MVCLCAVGGPYRANVFSWAGACYRYIGPLGLNQLGTYVPHKPQRGDISVTRHRRASVSKAPEGRHIGSKTSVQCFVYARSAAPPGPTCFLGRRPATNILARWATIRWAHTCRTSPVTRGRGLATNILALWATIPSAHTCRTSPVTRGRRPLQGQRVFLGRRLATNRLARWATNRSAHACR